MQIFHHCLNLRRKTWLSCVFNQIFTEMATSILEFYRCLSGDLYPYFSHSSVTIGRVEGIVPVLKGPTSTFPIERRHDTPGVLRDEVTGLGTCAPYCVIALNGISLPLLHWPWFCGAFCERNTDVLAGCLCGDAVIPAKMECFVTDKYTMPSMSH